MWGRGRAGHVGMKKCKQGRMQAGCGAGRLSQQGGGAVRTYATRSTNRPAQQLRTYSPA